MDWGGKRRRGGREGKDGAGDKHLKMTNFEYENPRKPQADDL